MQNKASPLSAQLQRLEDKIFNVAVRQLCILVAFCLAAPKWTVERWDRCSKSSQTGSLGCLFPEISDRTSTQHCWRTRVCLHQWNWDTWCFYFLPESTFSFLVLFLCEAGTSSTDFPLSGQLCSACHHRVGRPWIYWIMPTYCSSCHFTGGSYCTSCT